MDLRTGHPYWVVKNGLLATYPPLTTDERCDVAIVGAGITGALLSQSLSQAGMDCVVLDRRDAGSGSTAASTALLQYEIDTELWELIDLVGESHAVRAYRLGLEAIDAIEELARLDAASCEFERRESLYFASRRSHGARLRREFDCRRQHGFDIDFLEADEISERFSFQAPCGILSRGDAVIDAVQLTHTLLQAARRTGARIFDRTTVKSFKKDGDNFRLLTDRGPTVTARHLIMASGYES